MMPKCSEQCVTSPISEAFGYDPSQATQWVSLERQQHAKAEILEKRLTQPCFCKYIHIV